jgi:hypothetical protein
MGSTRWAGQSCQASTKNSLAASAAAESPQDFRNLQDSAKHLSGLCAEHRFATTAVMPAFKGWRRRQAGAASPAHRRTVVRH